MHSFSQLHARAAACSTRNVTCTASASCMPEQRLIEMRADELERTKRERERRERKRMDREAAKLNAQ